MAMFKRIPPADAKKEGSSSGQGSRSATPHVFSMLKSAGKLVGVSLSESNERSTGVTLCH